MPEDLPAEPSIKPLIDERQKARKKVAAQKTQTQLTMFDETSETPSTSVQETQTDQPVNPKKKGS